MGLLTKKPKGILCVDWEPDPDQGPKSSGRRCKYYIDGGTCKLPKRFLCEEWERANQSKAAALIEEGRLQGNTVPVSHPNTPQSDTCNSGATGPSGQSDLAAGVTRSAGTSDARGTVERVGVAHQEPYRYFPYDADPPPITEQTLKELERYGTTWLITEPDGKKWFVAPTHNVTPPVPVHQTITYREFALLAAIRTTFPGSKFERGGK